MTASGHLEFVERLSLEEAAEQLAVDAAAWLAAAIDAKGGAFIAAPGGTTPLPFFLAVSAKPLDWSKVQVTLTDERWVDEQSVQSNARLVRDGLLRGPAANAVFTPPQILHASLEDAAGDWDHDLHAAPPFDLVVLGMGEDGHFASLFPGGANLARNLSPEGNVFAVGVPDRDPWRLSLTLSAILRAEHICLLIAGDKKRALLDAVLRGEEPDLPIAALLRHADAAPICYWGAKS